MSNYTYKNILLVNPDFDSKLTSLIIDLDYLRKREMQGTTPAPIFFQLKSLFHTLESIGSARIEGNHTTIAEFIENKIQKNKKLSDEKIKEIENVEKALNFIDKTVRKNFRIDGEVIRHLHSIVVDGLSSTGEGDKNAGEYRENDVRIAGSLHIPPPKSEVRYYMKELTAFINKEDEARYDLLKIALTHHRFVWIHPFGNGNGRTVRLLTYAQLVKAGFNVERAGRIINPTAIFCGDRNKYYDYLAAADFGTREGLLQWCEYVLTGLKEEIEKVDKLTNYSYLSENILLPAINFSLDRKVLNETEASILRIALKVNGGRGFQAKDVGGVFRGKHMSHVSRYIGRMKNSHLISPTTKNARKYLIDFQNNYLIRGVIKMLDNNNFLPLKNEV
ncbi:MAG: Fic family protein [Candidatus Pacebacteria bacterium]|nr:Fic family protein [Candidatus Paceibacterota bacterium]